MSSCKDDFSTPRDELQGLNEMPTDRGHISLSQNKSVDTTKLN